MAAMGEQAAAGHHRQERSRSRRGLVQDGLGRRLRWALSRQSNRPCPPAPRDSCSPSGSSPPICRRRGLRAAGHRWQRLALALPKGSPRSCASAAAATGSSTPSRSSAEQVAGSKKATLFIYHDQIGQGTLGIDAVSFKVASEKQLQAGRSAGNGTVLTGDTSHPTLSTFALGEKVELTFSASGVKEKDAKLQLEIVDEQRSTHPEAGDSAQA